MKHFLKKISTLLRAHHWWSFIVPPILGFCYLSIYIHAIPFATAIFNLPLFFITIIGTAGFGFFVNDVADIQSDALTGKKNIAAKINKSTRILITIILLLIAITPWILLPKNLYCISLFLLQIIFLFIYSIEPFRLKKNIYAGVFLDACYSSVIFTLIGIETFRIAGSTSIKLNQYFILLLALWAFFKGLRNIFLHQLEDRKNDKKSHDITFAEKFPMGILNSINRLILPIELTLLVTLIYFCNGYIKNFFWGFVIFLLFSMLKYRFWEKLRLSKRHYRFMFIKILNDFYEEWFPLTCLIFLALLDVRFIFVLLIHLTLFPNILIKINEVVKMYWSDVKYAIKLIRNK